MWREKVEGTCNDLRCYICEMVIKIYQSADSREEKLKQLEMVKDHVEGMIKHIKEKK